MVNTWSPSSWGQRVVIVCIASIAVVITAIMSLYQWRLIPAIWDPVFHEQTSQVLTSNISHTLFIWFRIPDASLGCLAYIADIIFTLAGSNRRWYERPWLVFLFALNVIPLGAVSAVLVSLQGTVVGAYCFLCLITAFISLVLVFLGYFEAKYTTMYLLGIWKKSGSLRFVWQAFWGRPLPLAHQVIHEIEGKHVGTSC